MTRSGFVSFVSIVSIIIFAVLFSGKVIMAKSGSGEGNGTVKCYTTVEVQSGDTLLGIADKYMTAEYSSAYEYIDEVIALNHLTSTRIIAGEYIALPYYAAR